MCCRSSLENPLEAASVPTPNLLATYLRIAQFAEPYHCSKTHRTEPWKMYSNPMTFIVLVFIINGYVFQICTAFVWWSLSLQISFPPYNSYQSSHIYSHLSRRAYKWNTPSLFSSQFPLWRIIPSLPSRSPLLAPSPLLPVRLMTSVCKLSTRRSRIPSALHTSYWTLSSAFGQPLGIPDATCIDTQPRALKSCANTV